MAKFFEYPSLPKPVITSGAFVGFIIGIVTNDYTIYVPFLYSFLSKVPYYATNITEQVRVILLTAIILMIIIYLR